ncbi:MAG: hypothetical protein ABIA83_02770 [Patescibacteria group bacterium]
MEDLNTETNFQEAQKEFKREVAINTARPIIYKVAIALFIIFDVVLVGLLIFVTVGYLVLGQFNDRTSTAELVQNLSSIHLSAQSKSASSLLIEDVSVVSAGDAYDFVVELRNQNTDWFAKFDYVFSSSAGETEVYHGFILPQETRSFISLSQEFSSQPHSVEFVVSNLQWSRIDGHEISDVKAWYLQHSNFVVSDATHGTIKVGNKNVVSSTFTIQNNTPFSYWSAPFILLLKRNGVVVGINQFSVAGFENNETRSIQVNWFGDAPSSGDLVILPAIDYLDNDVYMSASSSTEVDIRD